MGHKPAAIPITELFYVTDWQLSNTLQVQPKV